MASTYTLNNGIELIGTGEQSGTWGDTTNENLQFIDTALDGQVTITATSAGTSGSPNTLPIADGQSLNSEGRNRMVIITSATDLGSTVYYQLTPNDAEKIIYIRNDLNAQDLIVFQGTYNSSNDYVVPNGTTAVIYFNGNGSGAVAANVFDTAYFDGLRLGNVSVTEIIDDDTMATASATNIATSESIKAYVDSQVTAQDLDFGGDSGTGAVDLDSQTFTIAGTANEIETSASGQTLTVGLPDDITIAGGLTVDTDTLVVDSTNDRVGVNVAAPARAFEVNSGTNDTTIVATSTDDGAFISFEDNNTTGDTSVRVGAIGDDLRFDAGNGEAMRIDSSERILFGDNESQGLNRKLQSVGTTGTAMNFEFIRFSNDTGSGAVELTKSRGTSLGAIGIVSDGDALGQLNFRGDDGVDTNTVAAQIKSEVDGTPGANDMPGRLVFMTTADGGNTATERMRIDSSGNVGINNTNPSFTEGGGLFVSPPSGESIATIRSQSSTAVFEVKTGSNIVEIGTASLDPLAFNINDAEAMRINSNGYAIISSTGNTRSMSLGVITSRLTIEGTSSTAGRPGAAAVQNSNDTSGPVYYLAKTRGTANNSNTIVQDDDYLGQLNWNGADGTQMVQAANISGLVDGTPGVNDMPGRLVFMTTADGASSPTERMRITSDGTVLIGIQSPLESIKLVHAIEDATSYDATNIPIASSGLGIINTETTTLGNKTTGITLFASDGTNSGGRAYVGVVGDGFRDGNLVFGTSSASSTVTEKMRISDDGKMSIGTAGTSSQALVQINGGADGSGILTGRTDGGNGNNERFILTGFADGGGAGYGGGIGFETRDTVNVFHEAMRIDSSQRVLINTASVAVGSTTEGNVQIATATGITLALRSTATAIGPAAVLALGRQNGTGIVSNNDHVGDIRFASHDGNDLTHESGKIRVAVDGTPGTDDVPGRLEFYTTADGANSSTERMRISASGRIDMFHDTVTTLDGTANTSRGYAIRNVGGSAHGYFQTDGDMRLIQEDAGKKMTFYTGNTVRLNINSNGGVAIGTGSGNLVNSGHFEVAKTMALNTTASGSYANIKQSFNGQITAGASGAWKDLARVDATHTGTAFLQAIDTAASVGAVAMRCDFVAPYGSGVVGNKLVQNYSGGNISNMDVRYLNSAGTSGTNYVLQVQVTYTGSSPTVYYTIEGMSLGPMYTV